MAYARIPQEKTLENLNEFNNDLLLRKEFYQFRYDPTRNYRDPNEYDSLKGKFLKIHSHQLFAQNYINPNTTFKRLLVKHETGTGKTLLLITIAQSFIDVYKTMYSNTLLTTGYSSKGRFAADKLTPSVFVIGFTKNNIINEILKFPEFGFITVQEREELEKLRQISSKGTITDTKRYHEFYNAIKRRVTNKSRGGFYRFYGYQEFVNRLFISESINMTELETMAMQRAAQNEDNPNEEVSTLEDVINSYIREGKIKINKSLLEQFENSILFCDEFQNTYNSFMKNNYGVAIQYILDHNPNMRAVFLSATPISNSPTEIVDIINFLIPYEQRIKKRDLFQTSKELMPGALEKIGLNSFGRVSFLQDINPKYYPERIFMGNERKLPKRLHGYDTIPYLKFIECELAPEHKLAWNEFKKKATQNDAGVYVVQSDEYTIYDCVFPGGYYKSSDVRSVYSEMNQDDRNAIGMNITRTPSGSQIFGGNWLERDNLARVSTKYYKLLGIIDNVFARQLNSLKSGAENIGEKIMIYHDRVKMSGVLFAQEVLRANGFVDEFSEPVDVTRCSICGGKYGDHDNFIKTEGISPHSFSASRFVIVNSEIDKNSMYASLQKYNSVDNAYGKMFKVFIGSKIIKEGFDMKDVREFCIMSSPINIPSLIQTLGRCIRKNSHINLPLESRKVNVSLFLSTYTNEVFPEEYRYLDKLRDYKVIQEIERQLHIYAIDADIHRDIIMSDELLAKYFPNTKDINIARKSDFVAEEGIGAKYFEPAFPLGHLEPSMLRVSTFNAYNHNVYEIRIITYIIKRLFHNKKLYKYDDLWKEVRAPPFGVEMNPKLFKEGNFIIALNNMISTTNYLSDGVDERYAISALFDIEDKYVYTGSTRNIIEQIGEYYILFPLTNEGLVIRDVESFIREPRHAEDMIININDWIRDSKEEYSLENLVSKFNTYGSADFTSIDTIVEYIGDFNEEFHRRVLRESIIKLQESSAADFKNKQILLLQKNIIGALAKFNVIVYASDVINNPMVKDKVKLANTALDAPAGYVDHRAVMLYNNGEWINVSKDAMNIQTDFNENRALVGYFERGADNDLKFKIRTGTTFNARASSDARTLERGMVCMTKSKNEVIEIVEKLHIPKSEYIGKMKIKDACFVLLRHLVKKEIEERQKGGKLKYFYIWLDEMPKF